MKSMTYESVFVEQRARTMMDAGGYRVPFRAPIDYSIAAWSRWIVTAIVGSA